MHFKHPKHHRGPHFTGGSDHLNNLKLKSKDYEITTFLKGIIDECITANIAVLLWDTISLLYFQFCADN